MAIFETITAVALAAASLAGPASPENASYALRLSQTDSSGGYARATLTCKEPAGSVKDPAKACAVLEAAGGKFSAIEEASTACPLNFAPVTVAVTGRWNGEAVDYKNEFPNACNASNATQGIFPLK
ncbi:Subtilisin inhibitor-like [Amycolatopsis xylanica]|uniref:Subtilisin inhibitor-like n=1 Tax=Amycolatopsis xylanica TaxID=589385 RepID=A0A1H3HCA9_9PSEU|nr:SSI family serine proteinase inhibitor [Amycolatopsis xylanica]SDY12508.1 Subtilisin inhibitor-like [Amycolatopsis xylanica]